MCAPVVEKALLESEYIFQGAWSLCCPALLPLPTRLTDALPSPSLPFPSHNPRRDFYLSAEESVEYGMVDQVILPGHKDPLSVSRPGRSLSCSDEALRCLFIAWSGDPMSRWALTNRSYHHPIHPMAADPDA